MKTVDPIPLERPTVLMVEADVLIRQPVAEYLRACGYRVLEAGSTDEALLVINAGMTVDVLFADAQAPGRLDGFGLANWIRKNRPGARVVLAGSIVSETREAGKLCEKGPHLKKPYDHALLADEIKRALAARARAARS